MSERPDLEARFETRDGSRPARSVLPASVATQMPLAAFGTLQSGQEMPVSSRPMPSDALREAAEYVAQIEVHLNGAPEVVAALLRQRLSTALAGNMRLIERLAASKPIEIELVPDGASFADYSMPASTHEACTGMFWNQESWPTARIALRQEHVIADKTLIIHELAHAVWCLAFSAAEARQLTAALEKSFATEQEREEVFAIYSEHEFLEDMRREGKVEEPEAAAPTVYEVCAAYWPESHLFSRFLRKLYFPYKALEGQRFAPTSKLGKFSGR